MENLNTDSQDSEHPLIYGAPTEELVREGLKALDAEPADVFPRVRKQVDKSKVEFAVKLLLEAVGEDTTRPGLKETPQRVAAMWKEFMNYEPGRLDTTFISNTNAMVLVSGIRVWSLCEHHLLPYYADLTIAYIPKDKVIGLSKIARIAHDNAHHLSLQERLVEHIHAALSQITGTNDIAVHAQGMHLCMVMRGIQTPAVMHTTKFEGNFKESLTLQQQFQTGIRNPLTAL